MLSPDVAHKGSSSASDEWLGDPIAMETYKDPYWLEERDIVTDGKLIQETVRNASDWEYFEIVPDDKDSYHSDESESSHSDEEDSRLTEDVQRILLRIDKEFADQENVVQDCSNPFMQLRNENALAGKDEDLSVSSSNMIRDSTETSCVVPDPSGAKKALVGWAIDSIIPRIHLTNLLRVLVDDFGLNFLPRDSRTLLKTPRSAILSKPIPPGHYTHFGISKYLNMLLEHKPKLFEKMTELKFIVNVDGIPLTKSSGNCFWPILCKIANLPFDLEPFIVGVYFGPKKPSDANLLLEMFVEEFLVLEKDQFYDS